MIKAVGGFINVKIMPGKQREMNYVKLYYIEN
jgi:hypothetical protein